MPTIVEKQEVERLLHEKQAVVVDVLPAKDHHSRHIPQSINIPIGQLRATDRRVIRIDRERPVVVYCFDHQCDLSKRAAHLLEDLGFNQVYEYAAGVQDWFDDEQSTSKPEPGKAPYAQDILTRDVPTCRAEDTVRSVRDRLRTINASFCVVVDDNDMVHGAVGEDKLSRAADYDSIREVMKRNTSTFRPIIPVEELLAAMRKSGKERVIISSSEGILLGVVQRARAEEALKKAGMKTSGSEKKA